MRRRNHRSHAGSRLGRRYEDLVGKVILCSTCIDLRVDGARSQSVGTDRLLNAVDCAEVGLKQLVAAEAADRPTSHAVAGTAPADLRHSIDSRRVIGRNPSGDRQPQILGLGSSPGEHAGGLLIVP